MQELTVKTDAFGRFSASITLPKDGLTGDYRIEARAASERDQELSSEFSCKFAVFEYKREGTELTVDMPSPPISMVARSPSRARCVRSVVAP